MGRFFAGFLAGLSVVPGLGLMTVGYGYYSSNKDIQVVKQQFQKVHEAAGDSKLLHDVYDEYYSQEIKKNLSFEQFVKLLPSSPMAEGVITNTSTTNFQWNAGGTHTWKGEMTMSTGETYKVDFVLLPDGKGKYVINGLHWEAQPVGSPAQAQSFGLPMFLSALGLGKDELEGGSGSKAHDIFDRIDTDHDGYLSLKELREAVKGKKVSRKQLAALIEELDEAGDGHISFEEFNKGLKNKQ